MFLLLLLFSSTLLAAELVIDERFSLHPPYYNQFQWKVDGSAMFTEEYVQLTPNSNSRTGQLWSREVLSITIVIKI